MQFSSALLSTNLPILSWRPRARFLARKRLTHIHLSNFIRVSSFMLLYLHIIHRRLTSSKDNRLLVLDLLSIHLIRNIHGSTIISFHPNLNLPTTTAQFLHERIRFAGKLISQLCCCSAESFEISGHSVYWQSIFQKSPDPTFILLTFVWHAMYAWDEALEDIYEHICSLVS